MNSDRIWAAFTVVILIAMTILALTEFETNGWMLVPVIGAVLYWIIRQAVAHGIDQSRRNR